MTAAPELSADERARVAAFDAAPQLAESAPMTRAMLALAEELDRRSIAAGEAGQSMRFAAQAQEVGKAMGFNVSAARLRTTVAAVLAADREPHEQVVAEVVAERARQDAKWGEQNHPDGTAVFPLAARREADEARRECQTLAARGACTWRAILAEEVAEAFAEIDPAALRTELIQVAAVAVQWVQAIDRRLAAAALDASRGGAR